MRYGLLDDERRGLHDIWGMSDTDHRWPRSASPSSPSSPSALTAARHPRLHPLRRPLDVLRPYAGSYAPGSMRVVIATRFQALIAVIAQMSWTSSSSSKCSRAVSNDSLGTCESAIRVIPSVS